MKTYVIPDLHGRYDLLTMALERISSSATGGTVVFLGDYVDRGPQSRQIIERLIAGPSDGWVWKCIRGNHEDMLLEGNSTKDASILAWWLSHGGETTMKSYDGYIPDEHLDWLKSLPTLAWDEHRVYTHAAVSEAYDLDDQPEAVTQWMRYPERANVGYRGRHVVHGHTPNVDGPELYSNRTNLDTKAHATGHLVVGVFDDDLPGSPIGLIHCER